MSDQNTDWKTKYRDLSAQHESLRHDAEDTQKVFCRTVIRLTMAVKGLDTNLDPYVNRIHDTVKKDCGPDISKKLDDLSDAMIRNANANDKQDPFDLLLSHTGLSANEKEKASGLWQKLAISSDAASDEDIDLLVRMLGGDGEQKNVAGADKTAVAAKTGLFKRLFAHSENEAGAEPNFILKDLLENLPWPNPIEPHIQNLVGKLDEGASNDMWVTVITRVNEIVVDTLSNFQTEVKSTETFLTDLSVRLEELEDIVQTNRELREASLQSGRELGKSMTEHVDSISSTMQSEHDLELLKEHVAERLDIIHSNVTAHIESDESRHRQAIQREQELRNKLTEVEQEAIRLKKQVLAASSKAIKDAVTGLPNRQAYDERIAQEYSRWKRFGEPLVLMVWDIDDFKQINDNYGHRSGDKALKVLAETLQGVIRETDFISRYGGEEFVVLLVGTNLEGAENVAEKIRLSVEQVALKANDEHIRLTISGGLSLFGHGDVPEDVFERADQALYKAKRSGKNQWVTA